MKVLYTAEVTATARVGMCPYPNAIRDNIDVTVTLVDPAEVTR